MRPAIVWILLALISLPAGEIPPPGPEEVQIVCLINRLRADPKAEAIRLLRLEALGFCGATAFKPEQARQEISSCSPAGPVVFSLELTAAARAHARYLDLNTDVLGLDAHFERDGLPGYVASDPLRRAQVAGFRGLGVSENVFQRSSSVWHSQQAFVIDWGPGKDGFLSGRGHRKNLCDQQPQEIGAAWMPRTDQPDLANVVHEMGVVRAGVRPVGGVVFLDRNRNGFYDLGEGLGDVDIATSTGVKTRSWPSGGFRLDEATNTRFTLTITGQDLKRSETIAPAKTVLWLEYAITPPEYLAALDRALAAVPVDAKAADRWARLVDLHLAASGAPSPIPATQTRITTLTASVAKEVTADQDELRKALYACDRSGFATLKNRLTAKYRGTTFIAWLKQATATAELYADGAELFRNPRSIMATAWQKICDAVDRLTPTLTDAEFAHILATLHDWRKQIRQR